MQIFLSLFLFLFLSLLLYKSRRDGGGT